MKKEPDKMIKSKSSNKDYLSKILWWFSTSIPESIEKCESDRYRSKIIGLGVIFTWIYASIAWIYLWSTNIESITLYVLLGLFIGFGILVIDRMLIASISKYRKNIIAIIMRVVLALFLGAFIAQPLILWMFNQDIDTEIAIIQEDKVLEKQAKLEEIYAGEKSQIVELQSSINIIKDQKLKALEEAEHNYLVEIDGTGGSLRYGIAGIAAQKEIALNRAKEEYYEAIPAMDSQLDSLSRRLGVINGDIAAQTASFRRGDLSAGFLIRVEALMSLFEKDTTGALKKRYYLILAILIIFELIPIMSKLFLQTGSYDDRIKLRDEVEVEIAYSNRDNELELKKNYNRMAKDSDMQVLEKVFSEVSDKRMSKINGHVKKWENGQISTFDDLWEKIKEEVMTKQEN